MYCGASLVWECKVQLPTLSPNTISTVQCLQELSVNQGNISGVILLKIEMTKNVLFYPVIVLTQRSNKVMSIRLQLAQLITTWPKSVANIRWTFLPLEWSLALKPQRYNGCPYVCKGQWSGFMATALYFTWSFWMEELTTVPSTLLVFCMLMPEFYLAFLRA